MRGPASGGIPGHGPIFSNGETFQNWEIWETWIEALVEGTRRTTWTPKCG